MKKTNLIKTTLVTALCFFGAVTGSDAMAQANGNAKKYLIEVPTPERPAGQKDMLGYAAPKMDKVRIGVIGLGMRGPGAVDRFCHIPGAEIVALCDVHENRVKHTQEILKKNGKPAAAEYYGSREIWKKLVERKDLDLIYIVTDWETHVPMSIYAMEQGKHVAVEVPAAHTMEDIWKLIDTSERTRKHCMMLENCVYDFFELTTLNMAQKGVLGDILYAEGAYIHQLEDFWDAYENDWRLKYNRKVRGDVYATHGMGPACQVMDIHRGDKMNYLVSMDSDPVSIPAFLKKDRNEEVDVKDFKNGQHTVTLIRTENGRTIEIHHDVASPRPYSRMYNVQGTKGYASKYPTPGYAIEESEAMKDAGVPDHENLSVHSFMPEAAQKALMAKYKHPIHQELEETAKKVGGHGGMDFIMDYRLIYCLLNGLPLDMDVYDMAEWSCLAPLTLISLENGSAPVEIPDFTRGGWNKIKGYRHAMVEDKK